jgi:hypothetical protein
MCAVDIRKSSESVYGRKNCLFIGRPYRIPLQHQIVSIPALLDVIKARKRALRLRVVISLP